MKYGSSQSPEARREERALRDAGRRSRNTTTTGRRPAPRGRTARDMVFKIRDSGFKILRVHAYTSAQSASSRTGAGSVRGCMASCARRYLESRAGTSRCVSISALNFAGSDLRNLISTIDAIREHRTAGVGAELEVE